jgi:hypothetical protein
MHNTTPNGAVWWSCHGPSDIHGSNIAGLVAKALVITFLLTLLGRADEVIE